jgi:hypothetical protein
MQGSRRFFITLAICFAFFVLINLIIWKGWTEVLMSPRYGGGDLTRLGFVSGLKKIRKTFDDLPSRHQEMKDYRGGRIDMITVGDSFSIGGGEGRNKYYQDYIATLSGMKVLNIPTYKFEVMVMGAMPASTLLAVYHAGWLDRIKPRYVLLESVERYTIPRLVTHFDLNVQVGQEELERYYRTVSFGGSLNQDISFINEGNFKFLYYSLMYQFSEHAFRRLVVKTRLTKTMFSGKQGDLLLFHGDDVQQSPLATRQNVQTANDNLNAIARLLRQKGITLIFMPVVDKLNLYRPFLKNDSYPRSLFFEELRTLPKEYLFIDTKAILTKAIEEGELDLFHQDDTHWTWKASQRVFSSVRFTMPPEPANAVGGNRP